MPTDEEQYLSQLPVPAGVSDEPLNALEQLLVDKYGATPMGARLFAAKLTTMGTPEYGSSESKYLQQEALSNLAKEQQKNMYNLAVFPALSNANVKPGGVYPLGYSADTVKFYLDALDKSKQKTKDKIAETENAAWNAAWAQEKANRDFAVQTAEDERQRMTDMRAFVKDSKEDQRKLDEAAQLEITRLRAMRPENMMPQSPYAEKLRRAEAMRKAILGQ